MIVYIRPGGAIVFDLDGTLVDSRAVVERQWTAWARAHGIEPRAVMEIVHGRPSIQTMRMFIPETTVAEGRAFDAIEAADVGGLQPVPGARAVIAQCDERGIRWAIVTSGTLPMATNRLQACGLPIPEVFVTVEQTERGKPAPDPFLRAAMLLQVQPDRCTVFEDSPPGVHSAKAAGMRVIAMTTTHPADHLSAADAIIPDLTSIEVRRQETEP